MESNPTRRQFIGCGLGIAAAIATGVGLMETNTQSKTSKKTHINPFDKWDYDNSLNHLKRSYGDLSLFVAGLPGFKDVYTRDAVISAILIGDALMLEHQLRFNASEQGTKRDPYTGEEPGKILHTTANDEIRGLSPRFNGCDTTALHIVGNYIHLMLTGDKSLIDRNTESIKEAAKNIRSHLNEDYLFREDPSFCNAEKFALKVTYWKDSDIPDRPGGEPKYPVTYTLAHILNMAALRCASKILDLEEIGMVAEKMKDALDNRLYDQGSGIPYIALDKEGPIRGVSSDLLHALFYLNPGDLSENQLKGIIRSSTELETKVGYRTLSPKKERESNVSPYHARTIWPFEQAIINIGARRFGLDHLVEVSSRIIPFLDTEPEIVEVYNFGKDVKKGGCDPQLWSLAAKRYFQTLKLPPTWI